MEVKMNKEKTKENFWKRFKKMFLSIFNKNKTKELPETTELSSVQFNKVDKKQMLEMYNNSKGNKDKIKKLSREELIVFIELCRAEIEIYQKKINNEITELNMAKRNIDHYKKELGEES